MTVTSSMILTTESIPKYLKEHWNSIGLGDSGNSSAPEDSDSDSDLDSDLLLKGIEVNTIQGGNVNYAFCIKFPSMNNKTVFLKQAPEFVAIFGPDGFPLTSERMQRELDVYSEYKTILGDTLSKKYLPDIYYFDKKHMIVIMEFLDGHDLLDHALVAKSSADEYNEEKIAGYLGDFMGRVHSATHSSNVTKERREYLTKHFENREMRDVQLEFVFTKCYKEATNEQRSGLTLTSEFMNEVELLKNQYNGVGGGNSNAGAGGHHVLCHGDLHPGSVMVNTLNGSTKVIDPEFTVYGPAGLDVGSLLHGYCLGAIHQAYSNNPNAVERIISSAETLWNSYKKALMENGNGNDGENGISADTMKEIEIETVGFTVAEVCRTALEFAGGRLWLQFDDVETKSASKKAALRLVDKCMIARHTGGIDLLFNELKNICSSI